MTLSAAFWSAIAASFAALSSFAIFLIQRANLYASVRPELVIVGWSRREDPMGDRPASIIKFAEIRNIGRGSALHVSINAFHEADDGRPISFSSTRMLDVIPAGDKWAIDQKIWVAWNNVAIGPDGKKHTFVPIKIWCYDTLGRHLHTTNYKLFVSEESTIFPRDDMLAPGAMGRRESMREHVTCLKLRNTCLKICNKIRGGKKRKERESAGQ